MKSESAHGGNRLTAWVVSGSVLAALTLVAGAIVWSLPLKVVAGGLQLLGILMTALAVGVVWSQLEQAIATLVDVKRGLETTWARRRHQLRGWWARKRGRPAPLIAVNRAFSMPYETTDELRRHCPDRTAITERDWLAALDDQMDVVYRSLNAKSWRLSAHRDELRAEIRDATRQGWMLIVAGLVWLAIGTALGMAA